MHAGHEHGGPSARIPIALKFGGAASAVIAAVVAVILAGEYREQFHDIQESAGQRLRAIAATAALTLDGDAQAALRDEADISSAAYQRLKAALVAVQRTNDLQDYDVLTLRRDGDGYSFVMGLRETSILGTPYEPPPAVRRVIDRAFETHKAQASEVYTDSYGSFVSAFAPLRDRGGSVVGLLEIDNDVSLLLRRLRERMLREGAVGATALALALLIIFLVARGLTRSISRLAFAMQEVEAGRYETRVDVQSSDEIGVLARVFESMLAGLRERLALLRFVPRHTRALITEQLRARPEARATFLAQRRDLVVLFSDIRGFTKMSDELPPNRIIEMLNLYLRKESDIIERHRGSVDKFIGDAVMAIFEGPDRFPDAADAALAIQATLHDVNATGAFERPVEVGIGVAGGEVIMGGVGSEERMELAVIGRLVNLASRLTSVAGGGEIIVSERVFENLAGRFLAEARPRALLKGFAEEQASYRLLGRSQ
jgi:class 3 adenylate cyclase